MGLSMGFIDMGLSMIWNYLWNYYPCDFHWRMGLSMDYLWIIPWKVNMNGEWDYLWDYFIYLWDYLWIIYGLSMDCRKEWICFKENMFFRFCEFQCLVLF